MVFPSINLDIFKAVNDSNWDILLMLYLLRKKSSRSVSKIIQVCRHVGNEEPTSVAMLLNVFVQQLTNKYLHKVAVIE